jgi:hypothetical protein
MQGKRARSEHPHTSAARRNTNLAPAFRSAPPKNATHSKGKKRKNATMESDELSQVSEHTALDDIRFNDKSKALSTLATELADPTKINIHDINKDFYKKPIPSRKVKRGGLGGDTPVASPSASSSYHGGMLSTPSSLKQFCEDEHLQEIRRNRPLSSGRSAAEAVSSVHMDDNNEDDDDDDDAYNDNNRYHKARPSQPQKDSVFTQMLMENVAAQQRPSRRPKHNNMGPPPPPLTNDDDILEQEEVVVEEEEDDEGLSWQSQTRRPHRPPPVADNKPNEDELRQMQEQRQRGVKRLMESSKSYMGLLPLANQFINNYLRLDGGTPETSFHHQIDDFVESHRPEFEQLYQHTHRLRPSNPIANLFLGFVNRVASVHIRNVVSTNHRGPSTTSPPPPTAPPPRPPPPQKTMEKNLDAQQEEDDDDFATEMPTD